MGGNYEVIHHSDLISGLIRDGKIKIEGKDVPESQPITYHDSCYLSRYNGILDSPRDILQSVAGKGNVVEMERNGKKNFCCGAGGGRMWMEERIGTAVNADRAAEAVRTGAKTVATACPFCMVMMSDGMKKEGQEEIQVRDIAEIVADSL